MTTFTDGPARGKTLMLHRAPFLLRVTELCLPGNDSCDETVWDGLDQPNDEPSPAEHLHAYKLEAVPGFCHLRIKGGGGFYPMATYALCNPQPPDAVMRTREAWVQWCEQFRGEWKAMRETS